VIKEALRGVIEGDSALCRGLYESRFVDRNGLLSLYSRSAGACRESKSD
jgi:hypothetical protein